MKKLKLNLDELKIESFITSSPDIQAKGTVKGFATEAWSCDPNVNTCGYQTCDCTYESSPAPGCCDYTKVAGTCQGFTQNRECS